MCATQRTHAEDGCDVLLGVSRLIDIVKKGVCTGAARGAEKACSACTFSWVVWWQWRRCLRFLREAKPKVVIITAPTHRSQLLASENERADANEKKKNGGRGGERVWRECICASER